MGGKPRIRISGVIWIEGNAGLYGKRCRLRSGTGACKMGQGKEMRPTFDKRTLVLRDEIVRERAIAVLRNLPIDPERPLVVTVDEIKPPRRPDQNALMWAGPLRDISEQAWLDGKKFSAEAWHELLKQELLPEEFDPELCREGYEKWTITTRGDRVLIGTTTKLTVKGMAAYLEQLYAFGASLGVQFHANPTEGVKR